jgi:hypothetical protein
MKVHHSFVQFGASQSFEPNGSLFTPHCTALRPLLLSSRCHRSQLQRTRFPRLVHVGRIPAARGMPHKQLGCRPRTIDGLRFALKEIHLMYTYFQTTKQSFSSAFYKHFPPNPSTKKVPFIWLNYTNSQT